MIKLSKELEKEVKDGIAEIRDISKYLIDNYPVKVIADELAELLLLQPTEQIIVSQEQFNSLISLFRVRGFKGTDVAEEKVERRGRPRGSLNKREDTELL